jgi:5-deoxy-5-amino-3-dehydroquinate synthase
MSRHEIIVDLGPRSYPIIVGRGVSREIDSHLPSSARRAVIVTQDGLPTIEVSKVPSTTVLIGRGEEHKSLETIERLSREFAACGLTRNDVIIGVGGGMVTDVAGFAASAWHRGTAVVHVATSLLAMVDAAIGGKTGVNIPEGKNLVGAFWQPTAVLCDIDHLDTLPATETRCGLGEIAKYHFISGRDLLGLDLDARIAACARLKADIVAQDEREGGRRALLNYGHTLAHAIETVGRHSVAHGEAVAMGLVFAAHLAHRMGRIDSERVALHEEVVGRVYGLATRPAEAFMVDDLMAVMARDKKATSGLTFILDSTRGLEVVNDVEPSVVVDALRGYLANGDKRNPSSVARR